LTIWQVLTDSKKTTLITASGYTTLYLIRQVPAELQEFLEGQASALLLFPAAKVERSLLVSSESQFGHLMGPSALLKLIRASNFLSHFLQ